MTDTGVVVYIRRGDAARYLGISVRTLAYLQNTGKVKFYKLGHRTCIFKKSELDEFVQGCKGGEAVTDATV